MERLSNYLFAATLILLIITNNQVFSQEYGNLVEMQEELIPPDQYDFTGEVFTEFAFFWDTRFDSATSFSKAVFHDNAEFNNSYFLAETDFSFAKFRYADFQSVKFQDKTRFFMAEFDSTSDLSLVEFNAYIDLSYSKFNGETKFMQSKFNAPVKLSNATFNDKVDFTGVEFNSDTDFTFTSFDSIASFSKVEFNGDVDFTSVVLPNRLDFSYTTKIADEIDLTRALFHKNDTCYINLVGAAIDKFSFRYTRFKLWFPANDSTIDYDLRSNVYEVLLEKQKDEGFTQSYEKLDREYREFMYTQQEGSFVAKAWGQLQNWVDKNWWGYGYSKGLIVLNTFILYMFFAFINVFFLKHLTLRVYEAEKINEYWNESNGSSVKMFFRTIPFSLFYTAQIFFSFKFDMDKLKYKENLQGWKIFNLVYFIIMYLAGLVCFAYLANYVVTV